MRLHPFVPALAFAAMSSCGSPEAADTESTDDLQSGVVHASEAQQGSLPEVRYYLLSQQ